MKIIVTIILTILSIALLGFTVVFVSAFRTVKKRWRDRATLLQTISCAEAEAMWVQNHIEALAERIVDPALNTNQKKELRTMINEAYQILRTREKNLTEIKSKVEVEEDLEKYYEILSAALNGKLDQVRELLDEMEKVIAGRTERKTKTPEGIFSAARCMTDLTRIYREKAKVYHPDNGGDARKFVLLQEEYKKAVSMMGRN